MADNSDDFVMFENNSDDNLEKLHQVLHLWIPGIILSGSQIILLLPVDGVILCTAFIVKRMSVVLIKG